MNKRQLKKRFKKALIAMFPDNISICLDRLFWQDCKYGKNSVTYEYKNNFKPIGYTHDYTQQRISQE
jgi:hypothetical protein